MDFLKIVNFLILFRAQVNPPKKVNNILKRGRTGEGRKGERGWEKGEMGWEKGDKGWKKGEKWWEKGEKGWEKGEKGDQKRK